MSINVEAQLVPVAAHPEPGWLCEETNHYDSSNRSFCFLLRGKRLALQPTAAV